MLRIPQLVMLLLIQFNYVAIYVTHLFMNLYSPLVKPGACRPAAGVPGFLKCFCP